jgi:hypothetical protein
MKLVETKISGATVRMRYADHPDSALATQWIDFQVPIAVLMASDQRTPLGDVEERYLAETHLAGLRHAREIIGAETQRLAQLVDHIA